MLLPRFIEGAGNANIGSIMQRGLPAQDHPLVARWPQDQSTSVPATATVTSPPFFPNPTDTAVSNEDDNGGGTLAKSVLEYLFLAVALLVVGSIMARRVMRLKRANQPMSNFFSFGATSQRQTDGPGGPRTYPRTTGVPPLSRAPDGSYTPYPEPHLTGFPSPYWSTLGLRNYRAPVRAGDIDENGRRAGNSAAEHDHDGMLTDKDMLPAYDSFGGPPKYVEIDLPATRRPTVGNPPVRPVLEANPGRSGNEREETTPTISTSTPTILVTEEQEPLPTEGVARTTIGGSSHESILVSQGPIQRPAPSYTRT